MAKKGKKKSGKAKSTSGLNPGVSMPKNGMGHNQKSSHGSKPNRKTIHESVCAITDPFCPRAKNAKWPDGMGGSTLTMQVRNHDVIATGAAGAGMRFYGASLPFSKGTAAYSGGVYTMSSAYVDTTSGSSFATYASAYRVVTWGIIIRNLPPALTACGYVIITRLSGMPALNTSFNEGLVTGGLVETHPLYAGAEIHVIGKPSGTGARAMQLENIATTQNLGWDIIKVEIVGGPVSTNCVDIEVVYNVEFVLAEGSTAIHQFVQPHAPSAPKAIEAANLVTTRVNTIVAGGVEKVGSKIMDSVEGAVEDLLSWSVGFLGF
jgi:hypothetical protein